MQPRVCRCVYSHSGDAGLRASFQAGSGAVASDDLALWRKFSRMSRSFFITSIMVLALRVASAHAQSARAPGWAFTGQLTAVWTGGNSEARTFGVNGMIRNVSKVGELKLEVGGIRTDATKKTRRAIGTAEQYDVVSEEHVERTAERYYGRIRYDRNVGASSVVFLGVDVLRNTFAGIDHRTLMAAGAGNVWVNSEKTRFKTDYGATYTFQHDVVENPFMKSGFPGARLSGELRRTVTTTTKLESAFISDMGFADTRDVRLDFTNSIAVSISSALSLKPSLQLVWRNLPALTSVPLYTTEGEKLGPSVGVPLEKLDEFFTLGLVLKL